MLGIKGVICIGRAGIGIPQTAECFHAFCRPFVVFFQNVIQGTFGIGSGFGWRVVFIAAVRLAIGAHDNTQTAAQVTSAFNNIAVAIQPVSIRFVAGAIHVAISAMGACVAAGFGAFGAGFLVGSVCLRGSFVRMVLLCRGHLKKCCQQECDRENTFHNSDI